jgi:hypothetical protein
VFSADWRAYFLAGWGYPLPISGKEWPPKGYTGRQGDIPTEAQMQHWADTRSSNIAMRLRRGVLGLDVDAHGNKPGAKTLADAIQRLGPLPATWSSTARYSPLGQAGLSSIRFYLVDPDLDLKSVFGPGIELIHFGARYAVVAPSIHPDTGDRYRWFRPNGEMELERPPQRQELAWLPDPWAEAITKPPEAVGRFRTCPPAPAGDRDIEHWANELINWGSVQGRNNLLNKAAWELRTHPNRDRVRERLLEAADEVGMSTREAERTLASGLGER